jgi:hypothetical protein
MLILHLAAKRRPLPPPDVLVRKMQLHAVSCSLHAWAADTCCTLQLHSVTYSRGRILGFGSASTVPSCTIWSGCGVSGLRGASCFKALCKTGSLLASGPNASRFCSYKRRCFIQIRGRMPLKTGQAYHKCDLGCIFDSFWTWVFARPF